MMKTRQTKFVTRKSNFNQRFTGMDDWTEEDDALFRGRRYAAHPVATTVNATNVTLLQQFFPETDREILQDVLVAAQYQVDIAAAMLGDMLRETIKSQEEKETAMPAVQSDLRPVVVLDVEMNDMDDDEDEDWSEVSMVVQQHQSAAVLTAVDMHPWVMVQDEWEVVDMEGEKVQTFAEVLRRSAANTPYVSQLPTLRVVELEKARAHKMKTLSRSKSDAAAFDGVERSVKSFGARKRRFLKTRA